MYRLSFLNKESFFSSEEKAMTAVINVLITKHWLPHKGEEILATGNIKEVISDWNFFVQEYMINRIGTGHHKLVRVSEVEVDSADLMSF